MNNVFLVNIFQSSNKTSDKKLCSIFLKFSESANMVPEITAGKVIHNEVKIFPILECIVHIDNV